jgi:hypothetical protein
MKYHTTAIGQRAGDIADKEAERVWRATGDYDLWYETWMRVYYSVLLEFHYI